MMKMKKILASDQITAIIVCAVYETMDEQVLGFITDDIFENS